MCVTVYETFNDYSQEKQKVTFLKIAEQNTTKRTLEGAGLTKQLSCKTVDYKLQTV